MDYRAVKPELGMMEDLLALAKDLRERGIPFVWIWWSTTPPKNTNGRSGLWLEKN